MRTEKPHEPCPESVLENYWPGSRGKGICRYCLKCIPLMKTKKHVRTHYTKPKYFEYGAMRKHPKQRCYGSRKLDVQHRHLVLLSEDFEQV